MDQLSDSTTKVSRHAVILEMSIFIRFCMINGQAMPVQFVCHTKPTILKLIAFPDTWVYDSEIWSTY